MTSKSRKDQKSIEEKRQVRDYFNAKEGGIFVEVGANEPTNIESQSWHLENELGWSGLLVEPNPQLAEQARHARPNAVVYQCACTSPEKTGELTLHIPTKEGKLITGHASLEINADDFDYANHQDVTVEACTLDALLEDSELATIDLLSVDVEGTEMDVLKGFDLAKYRPLLILMEDKLLYLEKHRYLKKNGYRLVKRTKQNNWYIPADAPRPPQRMGEKWKLIKKMYMSIWLRKLKFAFKSKRLEPLCRL